MIMKGVVCRRAHGRDGVLAQHGHGRDGLVDGRRKQDHRHAVARAGGNRDATSPRNKGSICRYPTGHMALRGVRCRDHAAIGPVPRWQHTGNRLTGIGGGMLFARKAVARVDKAGAGIRRRMETSCESQATTTSGAWASTSSTSWSAECGASLGRPANPAPARHDETWTSYETRPGGFLSALQVRDHASAQEVPPPTCQAARSALLL